MGRRIWKPEHRIAANRISLRYNCGLTNEEWEHSWRRSFRSRDAVVASAASLCVMFSIRSSMFLLQAAKGSSCRRTRRPSAPRIPISCFGPGRAHWSAFTRHSMWQRLKQPGARLRMLRHNCRGICQACHNTIDVRAVNQGKQLIPLQNLLDRFLAACNATKFYTIEAKALLKDILDFRLDLKQFHGILLCAAF